MTVALSKTEEELPASRASASPKVYLARVSRRVYLPAFSVVLIALGLVAVGWSQRWDGANFGASMTDLRVVVAGPAGSAVGS